MYNGAFYAHPKLFEREIVDNKSMIGRLNNCAQSNPNFNNTTAAMLRGFVFFVSAVKIPLLV